VALFVAETAVLTENKRASELDGIRQILRAQAHDSRHLAQIQSALIEQLAEKMKDSPKACEKIRILESCNMLVRLSLANGLLVAEGAYDSSELKSLSPWHIKDMCEDIVCW
jgi:hypothetical protein